MADCRSEDIAVIGMAGRFPGAASIEAFWHNVSLTQEALSTLSEKQLTRSGIDDVLIKHPQYVRRKGILGDVEYFDPNFFNMSSLEASVLDPQHRILIQCAWEAFENAGCVPQILPRRVGVFVGTGISLYLLKNLLQNTEIRQTVDEYQLLLGNDKDFLATRIGYLFNLKGPCVNVQTGCSSSLVAIHYACQSILNGECAMALAGGVSITIPEAQGYLYKKDMIGSPDGRCYAFDARAQGTVKSNGAGIVLLKLAEEAIRDNDHIYAIVRGTAINNDGAVKVGFTAPSVQQQADVVKEALQMADVMPSDIGYIETHGTGTLLGDPIEVKALKQAFASASTPDSCALTSLKSSFGHLDVAAGVASFIRACLAVYYAKLPASLNFASLNPQINLSGSPFYVNTLFKDWYNEKRMAGVSAFGIGGTNVHVVVQQPPHRLEMPNAEQPLLFVFSAHAPDSLRKQVEHIVQYATSHQHVSLQDIAYTLKKGRLVMPYRFAYWVNSSADLTAALAAVATMELHKTSLPRPLVWMFSGQGSQYPGMVSSLYATQPAFQAALDECCASMQAVLKFDLKQLLLLDAKHDPALNERLKQTEVTQPALFAVEYALARWYQAWGITPAALIGHSIGEYVAAVLAGVFSLADAASLVVKRGQLLQMLTPGIMVAVRAPLATVEALLPSTLDIALVNAPELIVVSGASDAMDGFLQALTAADIQFVGLHTSHAFHSRMLNEVLPSFSELVRAVKRQTPAIPLMSNYTGTWLTASEACSVEYWVNQLRHTVLFSPGIQNLQRELNPIFVEIGPSRVLQGLVFQHGIHDAFASLPSFHENITAQQQLQQTLVDLWHNGINFQQPLSGQVIPLPTYVWQKERCWIEPDQNATVQKTEPELALASMNDIEEQLAHLWRIVLGKKPQPDDHFFHLGGTSLTAITLIDKLPLSIKAVVSVVHLYQYPQFLAFVDFIKGIVTKQGEPHPVAPRKAQADLQEEAIFDEHVEL